MFSPDGVLVPASSTGTAAGGGAAASGVLGAAGAAAFAARVIEIHEVGSAVASLWAKSNLEDKRGKLNDRSLTLMRGISSARASGAITPAQARQAIQNVEDSWKQTQQIIDAKVQEYQDKLNANLMVNIGEWFQDAFGCGSPPRTSTKVAMFRAPSPTRAVCAMTGADVIGVLSSLAGQQQDVCLRGSGTIRADQVLAGQAVGVLVRKSRVSSFFSAPRDCTNSAV